MLLNASNYLQCFDAMMKFDFTKPVSIDTETISFDDKRAALFPYQGTRMALFIARQGGECYSILLRHRSAKPDVPFDEAIEFIKSFVNKIDIYMNQNPKFDMRIMAQDGIFFRPDAKIADTAVLARLVKSDLMGYSLDYMCKYFKIEQVKSSSAKDWIKQNNTQDYGAIPTHILVPYGEQDVYATDNLYDHLMAKLPEETKDQWNLEQEFCNLLFRCEHTGIKVDTQGLMRKRITILQDMIKLNKDICEIIGNPKFNPGSHVQVAKAFAALGVDPVKFTDEHESTPSWDKNALQLVSSIQHGEKAEAFASKLLELGHLKIQESTFCAAWVEHADSHNVIHPDFRQSGTNTGRLSCGDPNAQNFPEWMMEYMLIPEGHVGIKWDLSQIEYRIFTHYSDNPRLLAAYAENADVDFHQIIADLIGIPRKPVKPINFGILYGMGKKKLTASIVKAICESDGEKLRAALVKFTQFTIPPYPEAIPYEIAKSVAEGILEYYHRQTPEIRAMVKQIRSVLSARGYIRNFFGRRVHMTPDIAYVGLNYLIQGSSADLFKRFLVSIHKECPEALLIDNIHDADMSIVPIEHAQRYWDTSKRIIEGCDLFKVPIRMDGAMYFGNWGNEHKIKNNNLTELLGKAC